MALRLVFDRQFWCSDGAMADFIALLVGVIPWHSSGSQCAEQRGCELAMSGIEAGIALVIVILLLIYLVIALLKPEKF